MPREQLDHDLRSLERKLVSIAKDLKGGKEAIGKGGGPLKRALMMGAKPIMDEMIRLAPQGKDKKGYYDRKGRYHQPHKGGQLKASIRRERVRKPHLMPATEAVFIRPATSGKRKAPHWALVEFGTERMAPRRYMKQAADSRYGDAYEIFKWKLDREIETITRKLSRK